MPSSTNVGLPSSELKVGDVDSAVAVEIADPGYRDAEPVGVVEGGGEAAGSVGNFLFGFDGSVGVEE